MEKEKAYFIIFPPSDDNDPTNSSGRLPSTSLTSGTTMGTPKSGTKVPVADTETMATPSAVKTPVIQKIATKTPASVLNARVKVRNWDSILVKLLHQYFSIDFCDKKWDVND